MHLYFFPGRNPNRPYDVHQLFGAGGIESKAVKQWDNYQMESQKYLRIGITNFCYCFPQANFFLGLVDFAPKKD